MANDIKLVYTSPLMETDLQFADDGADLLREEGLETAVFISLFTDRRAKDDDPLDHPNDRNGKRGWWGDQVSSYRDDKIGSRLWLLARSNTTQKNLNRAEFYIKEALQWMIDDGVAVKIEVAAYRWTLASSTDVLGFSVRIYKKDGQKETFTFDDVWAAQYRGTP